MQTAAIAFHRFEKLRDEASQDRIVAAKAALGPRAVVLGHHYQREEVIGTLTSPAIRSNSRHARRRRRS